MDLEFVIKYWITFIFGLIAAGLGILAKHYQHLLKKEKDSIKQEEQDAIKTEMKQYVDDKFKEILESHEKLYKAVLDVQSKQFQRDCYSYLKMSRDITLEEFDSLYRNYEIYKSLGGNGIGTMLFEKVEERYTTQLLSEKLMDAVNGRQHYTPPPSPIPMPRVIYSPPVPPTINNTDKEDNEQ